LSDEQFYSKYIKNKIKQNNKFTTIDFNLITDEEFTDINIMEEASVDSTNYYTDITLSCSSEDSSDIEIVDSDLSMQYDSKTISKFNKLTHELNPLYMYQSYNYFNNLF
jgi:hypothetical protein